MIMKYQNYKLEDVVKESSKELFTVISCFAGGGGSSTGYRLAGGKILLINEFVEEAVNSYLMNYPNTKVLPGDIKKYSGKDFLESAGITEGELDILDGSPPCSAFSTSGSRDSDFGAEYVDTRVTSIGEDGEVIESGSLKKKNKKKNYSDNKIVEDIQDLFLEYVRIANEIRPKVIIAENVRGLTIGNFKSKLFEFSNAFENIGYLTTHRLINAKLFGVPQSRERTIFLCVREDVAEEIGLNMFTINSILPTGDISNLVSVKDAIHYIENDPEEELMLEEYAAKTPAHKKWTQLLAKNPNKILSPSDSEFSDINPKGSYFNLYRSCPDLPSPTLTQMGQQRSVSGVFHYEKDRKFTTMELRRLMSLPDDYILTGDFDKKAERIGRMVAPFMMRDISKSVYENIIVPYREATSKS
jgi:DNA (cytosine-5)-methyltransferase 1